MRWWCGVACEEVRTAKQSVVDEVEVLICSKRADCTFLSSRWCGMFRAGSQLNTFPDYRSTILLNLLMDLPCSPVDHLPLFYTLDPKKNPRAISQSRQIFTIGLSPAFHTLSTAKITLAANTVTPA